MDEDMCILDEACVLDEDLVVDDNGQQYRSECFQGLPSAAGDGDAGNAGEIEECFELEAANSEAKSGEMETLERFSEYIDITSPVGVLRNLLTKRFRRNFSEYEIWLQNRILLAPDESLVTQCVRKSGLVQVVMNLIEKDDARKINIFDVCQPEERISQVDVKRKSSAEWFKSKEFFEKSELKIPRLLRLWDVGHVLYWIKWAEKKFHLENIDLTDWLITGKKLCQLTHQELREKIKVKEDSLFWKHLEILRKCDVVAEVRVSAAGEESDVDDPQKSASAEESELDSPRVKKSKVIGCNYVFEKRAQGSSIQLWQFLLELLTDVDHQEHIYFISSEGEFKLQDPNLVAHLWGQRKNKPDMTYEKLSRALRYYYDGDMISKVRSKKFVYKFVCDLKDLIGYSASELHKYVTESCKRLNKPFSMPHFDSAQRAIGKVITTHD